MAEIKLQDVTKRYQEDASVDKLFRWRAPLPGDSLKANGDQVETHSGTVIALDALDLTVADGETMVVVGPSGCGKSTLLRVVAGLTEYEGLVTYDGQDTREVPVGERRIGMVFQNYALYPHFYGQGNLRFFFQVNKAPDAEAEERIRITSDMMGFGFRELLKRKPGTLSGGQQQRLAIARALVREPRLFLFDEPLSNLDAKLRTRTRVEIKRLLHRFGITAIYVTHDQIEAMALGDRVAVMRKGRIEQVGVFAEVLQDPVNAFVAGFLGTPPMNLLGGIVSGEQIALGGSQQIPVPEPLLSRMHQGQEITVGIRPGEAHARARDYGVGEGAPSDSVVFRGTVDVVEPDFGRQKQTAYVSTEAFSCSVTAPLELHLVTGYETEVVFPLSALFFFDAETGERIK
ncbi:MAG: ATP-binding cassette domain-containing protein [Anaerolineae bacterium]|nr:ATP-binding cassette domain-containing protein [Anaerolineae bacterium]